MSGDPALEESLVELLILNNVPAQGRGRNEALTLLAYASSLNRQIKAYSGNRLKLHAFCGNHLAGFISGEYQDGCRRCGADPDCNSYTPILLRPVQAVQ